ncbi:MAG: hypothetical protein IT180_16905 [Acidobacteria bacterium]|nr:hypothetical protein [Acidobacteriota bacterium]
MTHQPALEVRERGWAATGGQFVGLKADVRDPTSANEVIERALRQFGKVDFLLASP